MSNFSTLGLVSNALTGTAPTIFVASTPDALATITAVGYLNDIANKFKQNDKLFINYLDTSVFPLNPGENATYGEFQIVVSGGNTSLVAEGSGGGVTLPVVSGHVPVFNGTSGVIQDIGLVPSDPTQDIIVMSSSSTVIGNVPAFTDLVGTIHDSGLQANKVMQSAFASPDVESNIITVQSSSLSNANIVAGTNIFTPTGSKTYLLLGAILTITTPFAGGSNNSNLNFTIANLNTGGIVITATSTAIKAAVQSYALGQSGFAFAGSNISITATNNLFIKADTSSDYTSGAASVIFVLLRTA